MFEDRIVADSRDYEVWKAARPGRVGASDAARYAKMDSAESYLYAMLAPSWDGNQYSAHGHEREPIILADHGYEQNTFMFHGLGNPRHVATPDGVKGTRLAQVKCTSKSFVSKRTKEVLVPAHYRRQIWWEQYVMGPDYTESDFIYEEYKTINGVLVPAFQSVKVAVARDEAEIEKMKRIADEVLRRYDLAVSVPF